MEIILSLLNFYTQTNKNKLPPILNLRIKNICYKAFFMLIYLKELFIRKIQNMSFIVLFIHRVGSSPRQCVEALLFLII